MKVKPLSKKARARLEKLRDKIDTVDRKMMQALAKRFRIVDEIGRFKATHKLPVVQKSRMNEMLNGRKKDSARLKLDPKLIYNIFDLLHEASIEAQERVINRRAKRKSKR